MDRTPEPAYVSNIGLEMKREAAVAKLTLETLGLRVAEKREDRGVREVAKEIGISPATLSRVERGNLPDLETFGKICRWLGVDPGEVLGFTDMPKRPVASVHFKKEAAVDLKTAQALSDLILQAHRSLALMKQEFEESPDLV